MKKLQKGFGTVEGLLLIVIVGIIAFTGWYVLHASKTTNSVLNSAANTGTLPKVASGDNSGGSVLGTPRKPSTACAYTMKLGTVLGAAGTFHQDATFTNTSVNTCTITGYPKVRLIDTGGGTIGGFAASDSSVAPVVIKVAPGYSLHATYSYANPTIATGCASNIAANLGVILPGVSNELTAADKIYWCPGFTVGPLEVGAGT